MLEPEASVEGIPCIFPSESAEKVRPHASVQILADLERDFDFLREGRRNVLGNLILRRIETRIRREICDTGCRIIFDLHPCG